MFYSVERRKHLSLLNFMRPRLNRLTPRSPSYPIPAHPSNYLNQAPLSSCYKHHIATLLSHYSSPIAQKTPISLSDRYQNIQKWE